MRPPFVLPQGRTIRKLLGEAGEVQKKFSCKGKLNSCTPSNLRDIHTVA